MQRVRNQQAGFTLVELLIVVIIVGILAVVSIHLYRSATSETVRAGLEADKALFTIRSLFRTVQSQAVAGDFSALTGSYTASGTLKVTDVAELNFNAVDLEGLYFDEDSYRITTLTNTTYVVKAYGDSSGTANQSAVAGLIRSIDQDGTLSSPAN